MIQTSCRYFNGYKPCGLSTSCNEKCPSRDIPQSRILIVHLEALGAVLRSTSLLPAIKRKFRSSHITWVTKRSAIPLLENNPLIDRTLSLDTDDLLSLRALEFDFAFCIDKSLSAAGVLATTNVDIVYGFVSDKISGAIVPATPSAMELWKIGLSDELKFFVNQKSETQLAAESLELEFRRDDYGIYLTPEELKKSDALALHWGKRIIGINTGCSPTIKAKKLTVETHRELIRRIGKLGRVVLLGGGSEDTERNLKIGEGLDVIQTPCEAGIRSGLVSMNACDIVISGDSLGMHMAIGLRKWVVAWFGPTCEQEIDLYERGIKVKTQASCSPCWKRSCSKSVMCYDQVSIDELVHGVKEGLNWLTSSSKQPISEISSSRSL